MTLTEIREHGSTEQRKALRELKESHSAFRTKLSTLEFSERNAPENVDYFRGLVRHYQNKFDTAKANFQKELGLNGFETQEIINRFK